MAEPLMINTSTAATGTSTERPPVLGSIPSLGIVSRMTPSLAEVVSPPLVAAPVVLAPEVAPALAPVVVSVEASVVPVVVPVVVLVVVPVVVPAVVSVVPMVVVPAVPVVSVGGPVEGAPWQRALPVSASVPSGAVTN